MIKGSKEATIPVTRCEGLRNWEVVSEVFGYSLGGNSKIRIYFPIISYPFDPQNLAVVEFQIRAHLPPDCYLMVVSFCEAGIELAKSNIYCTDTTHVQLFVPEHKLKYGAMEFELVCRAKAINNRDYNFGDSKTRTISIESAQLIYQIPADESKNALILAGERISEHIFPKAAYIDRFWNVQELTENICAAIKGRTPYSVVRLGDGEGRILGYPWLMTETETLRDTIHYMFGPTSMKDLIELDGYCALGIAMRELSELILQATRNADVLGLPSPYNFEQPISNAQKNSVLGSAAALIFSQKSFSLRNSPLVVDTFIFRKLQAEGLFETILSGLPFLGVVAHTIENKQLSKYFSIDDVVTYQIPAHFSFMPTDSAQYPRLYKEIIYSIKVPYRGAVFIVAAGYLGKCYCDAIKQKGGIALDIGSVFDGWFGRGRPDALTDAARLGSQVALTDEATNR